MTQKELDDKLRDGFCSVLSQWNRLVRHVTAANMCQWIRRQWKSTMYDVIWTDSGQILRREPVFNKETLVERDASVLAQYEVPGH